MDLTDQITRWFTVSTPEPTHQNFNTQMGVHVEEIAEMFDAITGLDETSERRVRGARMMLHALATELKQGGVRVGISDPKEFLDSICDQNVTGNGAATLANLPVRPALQDTADSNDSKFVDGKPLRDPQTQKITKGPDYWRVDLSRYVEEVAFAAEPFRLPEDPEPEAESSIQP